jgi:hypothetical protein
MVFSSRVVDPIDVPAAIRELIPDSFSCELDVVTVKSLSLAVDDGIDASGRGWT